MATKPGADAHDVSYSQRVLSAPSIWILNEDSAKAITYLQCGALSVCLQSGSAILKIDGSSSVASQTPSSGSKCGPAPCYKALFSQGIKELKLLYKGQTRKPKRFNVLPLVSNEGQPLCAGNSLPLELCTPDSQTISDELAG